MSQLPISHQIGQMEDYCDRWPAKQLLLQLSELQVNGETNQTLIQARRTYFTDEKLEFFDISVARSLALAPGTNSCVSMGFLVDTKFKRTVRFWDDPAIERVEVPLQNIPERYIRRANAVQALLDQS